MGHLNLSNGNISEVKRIVIGNTKIRKFKQDEFLTNLYLAPTPKQK